MITVCCSETRAAYLSADLSGAGRAGGAEALVGVRGREADVDDGDEQMFAGVDGRDRVDVVGSGDLVARVMGMGEYITSQGPRGFHRSGGGRSRRVGCARRARGPRKNPPGVEIRYLSSTDANH